MPRHPASIQFLDLDGLPSAANRRLDLRVEELVRRAILAGNLTAGARLPSSRLLARDLGVSRHTVEHAFDQLVAEGFLVRRRGSGTYVASDLPARPRGRRRERPPSNAAPALSRRGAALAGYPGRTEPMVGTAFTPSIPALELFPRAVWARLLGRAAARPGMDCLAYGASNGLPELRRAIAAHVAGSRAVSCEAGQVIVTASTQQAVDLVTRVLLDPGDPVWVEDPSYPPVVHLLRAAGAEVHAIPVDDDGLDVERAVAREPRARLAYVTPSHQYPAGGLMSLPRRLALLRWAERSQAWIVEDDYDGDLRYAGRPLASLQALEPAGRVIYIGTFNKMLFPALRIAFLVAPPALVEPFLAAKHLMDGHAPGHAQAALAEFIEDGHLATHLRRLLPEYAERRQALLGAIASQLPELEPGPSAAGLHLAAYLTRNLDDRAIAAACARVGVDLDPLSRFYVGHPRRGFVLGFACSRPARTRTAIPLVARAIRAAKVVR